MQNEKRLVRTDSGEGVFHLDRARINDIVYGMGYVLAAYLIGCCRLAFGTYPLGVALLCAAPRRVMYIFAGLVCSALAATPEGGVLTGAYVITLVLRIICCLFIDNARIKARESYIDDSAHEREHVDKLRAVLGGLFGENLYLRMTVAAVSAFVLGLCRVISGGYHYYDLFGTVFCMLLSPVAVLLFGWFWSKRSDVPQKYKYIAGCGALLAAVCFSARNMTFLGVSVVAFGGMLVSLIVGARRGILAGCAVAFVCGLAFDPTYTPLFVLAVVSDGILRRLSPTVAALTAFAASMLWGTYIDGMDVLTRLLPGLLLATCSYMGAARVGWLNVKTAEKAPPKLGEIQARSLLAEARVAADEQKLRQLSDSFESLSKVFYDLSDRLKRPGIIDLRRVCDNAFDAHCPGCPRHQVCWGLEYGASLDMISRLATRLSEQGRADVDCLPESVIGRCEIISDICDEINVAAGALTESVLRGEKIGVFALDFESMAKILTDAVQNQRREYQFSEQLTDAVQARLDKMRLDTQSLIVYGGRRKYITARLGNVNTDSGRIRYELGQAVGCELEEPMFEFDREGVLMTLTCRRRWNILRSSACLSADSGEICGDSVCMFENDKDIFYALISDGMGSGSEAAFCSGLAAMFLEKMLMAGNRVDTSLKMLNGVLRSKGGAREMECSATVDLLSVDMLTGEASVIKSGAAPTYVRRGGEIFRLHSETVPLGILNAIDARRTTLDICDGDVIIMVSDGVSDVGEGEWLAEVLCYEWEEDLSVMANKIVGRAQSLGSRDDVSAIIVKVEKA